MPNEPIYEGKPVTDRRTGGRPPALRPAVESMTLLAAAVIVHDTENDRVVLLQRGPGAKYGNGLWDLPAGKSDPGEPITETAVRELREETGLVVDPRSLRVAHLIHGAWGVEAPCGFLTVVFATHEWTGEPVNAEPAKHLQVRWTGTGAIPAAIVPTTGIALGHYLVGGAQLSIAGFGDAG
ncbi:NUDIX domain-containing protein [Streptomyces sp. NPDC013157]|uniref:NUDIX domain-containing protein n=1 Tax=Streptomyces sp. NPDC013157 TaxID=3364861 RepID=UPI0036B2F317